MHKLNIGPSLKAIRKRNKLTQEQLAQMLGYSSKSVICHIEKGDIDMTYEKMVILIQKLKINPEDLFDSDLKKEIDIDKHVLQKKEQKTIVVYIHGLHGSHDESKYFDFFDKFFEVVGLDYPDGNPWELEDVLKSRFAQLVKDYKDVIVVANSIGAFLSVQYLSEFNIKQAFFISPLFNMPLMIRDLITNNGLTMEKFKEMNHITLKDGTELSYDYYEHLLNNKDNWSVPTDILYGSEDELIPLCSVISFISSHPYTRLSVKNGSKHYFHTEEERKYIKEWILRSLIND